MVPQIRASHASHSSCLRGRVGRSRGEADCGEPEAAGRAQGREQRGLGPTGALGQAGFYHQKQHVTKKHRLREEASFPVVTRPAGENAPPGPEVVLGLIPNRPGFESGSAISKLGCLGLLWWPR